jgi:hypothetical protein
MTGALHKPLRNRDVTDIKNIIDFAKNNNPIKKITFIGSAIADHPNLLKFVIMYLNKSPINDTF